MVNKYSCHSEQTFVASEESQSIYERFFVAVTATAPQNDKKDIL